MYKETIRDREASAYPRLFVKGSVPTSRNRGTNRAEKNRVNPALQGGEGDNDATTLLSELAHTDANPIKTERITQHSTRNPIIQTQVTLTLSLHCQLIQ